MNAPFPPSDDAPWTIHRLSGSDALAYQEARLEGLARHPEAFGASWEEEVERPLSWFAERLDRNAVFGAPAGEAILAGVAGLRVPDGPKLRHKGVIWGVYVRPSARRRGLAAALLARTLDHARTVVEGVRLSVATSSVTAVRFAAGFAAYGLERCALKVDGRCHDELLMALPLGIEDRTDAAAPDTDQSRA